MGEGTKVLIEAREETKPRTSETLFNEEDEREVTLFRTGDVFKVADMTFHPIHVDHSVPAAYGFVVEADGGVLAYTGDLRVHGPRKDMTEDFIRKCVEKGVDVLVTEGTRIDESEYNSEESVMAGLLEITSRSRGKLVSVVVGMLDFDRLNTILKVAESAERIPVISLHHAHVLNSLKKGKLRINVPRLEEDRLVAYLERRRTGTYSKSDYPGWMAELIDEVPTVKEDDLRSRQDRYILILSKAEDIIDLADVKPPPRSPFILSTSEPHSEEQELEMDKINNWVNLLGLSFHHVHSSGHANSMDLFKIIEAIGPRKIVPVHTERPELFERLVRQKGIDANVVVLGKGASAEVF